MISDATLRRYAYSTEYLVFSADMIFRDMAAELLQRREVERKQLVDDQTEDLIDAIVTEAMNVATAYEWGTGRANAMDALRGAKIELRAEIMRLRHFVPAPPEEVEK